MPKSLPKKSKMPDLVINTGPIIALTAAQGALDCLAELYGQILVPYEVLRELEVGGLDCAEVCAVRRCSVVQIQPAPVEVPLLLGSQLDRGEAAVIQTALDHRIATVVIDECLGRRMARLHALKVTGSLGILVKAAKAGLIDNIEDCFERMHEKEVWISEALKQKVRQALK